MNYVFIAVGLLFLLIGMPLACYQNTINHETIHSDIFVYGGCEEVVIETNIFSGKATCLVMGEQVLNGEMYVLHSINEIVTYNMHSLITYLGILIFSAMFIGAGLFKK